MPRRVPLAVLGVLTIGLPCTVPRERGMSRHATACCSVALTTLRARLAAYAARLAVLEEVLDALGGRLADEAGCLSCFEHDPNARHHSLVAERMRGRRFVRAVDRLEP